MNDEPNNKTKATKASRKRPLPLRLLRWAVWLFAAFVIFILALLAYTETGSFRSMLRDILNDELTTALNADVHIGEIHGNIFSGWRFDSVTVRDEYGPVLETQSIIIRYNPFRIPWQRITLSEISLIKPHIFVTKGPDRDWNIERMFPPSPEDTTESAPFNWTIEVQNIRIIDGMLVRYDSTNLGPHPTHTLDMDHLVLKELNVALAAHYSPSLKKVSLFQFRFENVNGDVDLHNISGDIVLQKGRTDVNTFSVSTSRSSFQLDLALDSLDVFDMPDTLNIFTMPFDLAFESPKFDTRDLLYFLPSLDFLGGIYSLSLDADGTLNKLALTELDLETEGIHINLAGELRDVEKGAEMYIGVESDHLLITGDRVPEVLPGIDLPDYSEVGELRFSHLTFHGEPLKFRSEIDFTSGAGNAKGFADLDFTGDDMEYESELTTQNLDLGKIFKSNELSSNLTGKAIVSGIGTSPGSMNTTIDLKMDSSRFREYYISRLTSVVALGPSLMRTRTLVYGNGGTLELGGRLTFDGDSVTNVEITASGKRLNLDSFFPGQEMASDLNVEMQVWSNGIDLSSASGRMHIDMQPSSFSDFRFAADTLLLTLDQHDAMQRELTLASSYADISMRGEFDIPRFATDIAVQIDSMIVGLEKLNLGVTPDSASLAQDAASARARGRTSPAAQPVYIDSADYMNATYSVTLKEPERLASYFNASMVDVRGNFEGSISGGPRGFDIDGNVKVTDFYYVDSLRIWKLAGLKLGYDFKNLRPEQALADLDADVSLSIEDLGIGKTHLTGLAVNLALADATPTFAVRGSVDTTLRVGLRGTAAFHDSMYVVTLPQLAFGYNSQLWSNAAPVEFSIDTGKIIVRTLTMRHNKALLNIEGTRTLQGYNDLALTLDSIRMGELEYLLTSHPDAMSGNSFTGVATIEANLKGPDAEPIFAVGFYVDSLGYRDRVFGKLEAEATYNEGQLELYSEMDYLAGKAGNNVLFISGAVPAAISLAGEPIDIDNENANLKMKLQDFPLQLIEQFVGGMDFIEGTANADITISGTTTDPEFSGFLEITNGEGRLQFNNMRYKFAARVEPEGRRFAIKSVTVQNRDADWAEGRMEGSGYIDTKELGLTGFELVLRGKLQVLKEESRANLKFMYGTLYAGTGGGQLSLSGRFDKPIFSGELIILEGEITLAQDQRGRNVTDYSNVNYIIIDDLKKNKESSLFGRMTGPQQMETASESTESAFTSNLSYDLALSTGGRFLVIIPFSTITQEELHAYLDMSSFRVTNWGGEGKFVGEVEVVGDSYYLFWGKRFKASGVLRFTNDVENPDLDLRAIYTDEHVDAVTKERRNVFVVMNIKGTQKDPIIDFELRYDSPDGPSVASGGDIKSDALSFVLFGQFSNELTQGAKGELAGQISQSGVQLGYSLFSSAFSSLLSDVTPIERFEIQERGPGRQAVSLTSSIGGFYVTATSQLNTVENSEFSVERQISDKWFIAISRIATDRSQEAGTTLQADVLYELKLLYRISF